MWAYLWVLYSVALIYVSLFAPVPCCFDYCGSVVQCEVRECDTSSFVLYPQHCFSKLGSFVHINFRIICSSSVKNIMGIFIGIALILSSMDILKIVILTVQGHWISFNFFVSFSVSWSQFYSFQSIGLSPPWLSLLLDILFFLLWF